MDKLVVRKHRKNYMTFNEFAAAVSIEAIGSCSDLNLSYWNSKKWQTTLAEEYKKYSETCKSEDDWHAAINAVIHEFDEMF